MDQQERTDIRSGDRVIEVGPPDLDLARWCLDHGASYLALAPGDRVPALRGNAPADLTHLVAPLHALDEITANNAHVLVLHAPYHRLAWQRRLGDVDVVATPARGAVGVECAIASRLVRRRRSHVYTWGSRRYRAIGQRVHRSPAARRYLSPAVGVAGLPSRLDEHDIDYAVLRWFDALPDVEPGEDLDILVADSDLPKLIDVLESAPGTIACDVYSATGLPGADYQGMAYYPPRLATEILTSAERHPSGYRVPDPRAHFRSLAFHAVYHKGSRSGLPTEVVDEPVSDKPEHDYVAALTDLAPVDGFTGPITMEALDDHLASVGWRPSRDNLARLAEHNAWLRARHFGSTSSPDRAGDSGDRPVDDGATTVFVLRERAGDRGRQLAEQVLDEHGFEILAVHRLDDKARERCTHEMRGGNWGPGPYPVSGGEPDVAIVALDRAPRRPTAKQLQRYPGLANANVFTTKLAVRDAILADITEADHFNPVHSSDCELDAWEYVELTMPEEVARIRRLVAARRPEVAPLAPPDPTGDSGPEHPAPARDAVRRRGVRSLVLWLPRRTRAFLGHRLGKWRLSGLTEPNGAGPYQ